MTDHANVTTTEGIKMPRLLYGTAWKKDKTSDLVVKALQLGFRGIDTACQPKHYNEAGVGQALAALEKQGIPREALFLQTKFTPLAGQDPQQIPYNKDAALHEQVAQSFVRSQKNLDTNYVDSLVLHSPLSEHSELMEVWKAMEDIHELGGARQLGISNCYDLSVLQKLYEQASVKPAVVQNRFYEETSYDKDLRKWCIEKGIIYQSFWTLSANPHVLTNKTFLNIAQQINKTAPQVLFRFLSQIGIVPLTGTSSEQHMREDLAIFEFELSDDHCKDIRQLMDI